MKTNKKMVQATHCSKLSNKELAKKLMDHALLNDEPSYVYRDEIDDVRLALLGGRKVKITLTVENA